MPHVVMYWKSFEMYSLLLWGKIHMGHLHTLLAASPMAIPRRDGHHIHDPPERMYSAATTRL